MSAAAKWLLVPVNIERCHWFLLALELEIGIVWVVDSMFASRVDMGAVGLLVGFIQSEYGVAISGDLKIKECTQ